MTGFWGYESAALLAIIVISTLSALCLYCAWRFTADY
jgi:hypothetical protein